MSSLIEVRPQPIRVGIPVLIDGRSIGTAYGQEGIGVAFFPTGKGLPCELTGTGKGLAEAMRDAASKARTRATALESFAKLIDSLEGEP